MENEGDILVQDLSITIQAEKDVADALSALSTGPRLQPS